ncbi:MAG: hypothetical protein QXU18_11000 [Thermoplasmatales archaeon]
MPVRTVAPATNNTSNLYKYDESLLFKLPGSGSARSDCGQLIFVGHLADLDIHWHKHKKSCHRRECPICYPDWVRREALNASDRLSEYVKLTGRKIIHYVVSPPQSKPYSSITSYKALRNEAYRISGLRGIKGGVMIFHERAIRYEDGGKEYKNTHCSNGPHFHILGDGWLSNIQEFFLKDGWIVKNLRIRSKGSEIRTLYYILEHAAIGYSAGYPAISHSTDPDLDDPDLIKPRINAVTWFGTMSYNKLRIQKFQGSNTIYCPICKTEVQKSEWFRLYPNGYGPPENENFGSENVNKNSFSIGNPISMFY